MLHKAPDTSMPDTNKRLSDALHRLHKQPFTKPAVAALNADADTITRDMSKTALVEIPAFSETANPEVLQEMDRHSSEHTEEILRLLGGGDVSKFEFVQQHAQGRAEQNFPLEITLHAYRVGQRVYSRWIRKAFLAAADESGDGQAAVEAAADFAIEYTDAISTVVTRCYIAHTRLLADLAGDHRAKLLSILLDGYDEGDGRIAGFLRKAGYLDQRQSYCIVLARSVDPSEMLNPARARRLADAVKDVLHDLPIRQLSDVRDGFAVTVVSTTRRISGWTAPRSALAKQLQASLQKLGPAVLVGVSNDVPATGRIPVAYREANLSLDIATVANRVVQFSDITLQKLTQYLAGDQLQKVLPQWASTFQQADEQSESALTQTLEAYAAANMNVIRAAKRLKVHPNTVYFRLNRVHELTGYDAREYHALTELLIAAACFRS